MMATVKRLARKWRTSPGDSGAGDSFSLPTVDDSRPIDTHEQEEVVRSFERDQAQQSLLWRFVFTTLVFGYVAFLVYSIYQQASYPWELRYHAYFMEDIDSGLVIFADWIAVLACLMCIGGLLHSRNRRWIWYSSFPGTVLALFWLYYMLRLPKFRWEIIWLPFGSLGASGICLYVDRLLYQSSEEVKKLRNYMYSYKTR